MIANLVLRDCQDEFTAGDSKLKQKCCDMIRSNPMVLNCSLNHRVRPRFRLATSKGMRPTIGYLISSSDAKFCEQHGKSSLPVGIVIQVAAITARCALLTYIAALCERTAGFTVEELAAFQKDCSVLSVV